MPNVLLSLVGAGPGDPDLITLKAIKTLQNADAILYDALANDTLLQYASAGCQTIYVGKRCSQHHYTQKQINNRIISLASTCRRIVRLKGGDPGVFGRAQEEIEVARQYGMDVEIIPGISSTLGIAGANGFPLTARGYSESIWIGTGTTRAGHPSADLLLAAKSSATLVILMAMHNLEAIQQILMPAGKASTPIAIIVNGTTTNQQLILSTVSEMVEVAREEQITHPAILIVGSVVRLHPSFWPGSLKATLPRISSIEV